MRRVYREYGPLLRHATPAPAAETPERHGAAASNAWWRGSAGGRIVAWVAALFGYAIVNPAWAEPEETGTPDDILVLGLLAALGLTSGRCGFAGAPARSARSSSGRSRS